jgi:hemoglobin
MTLYDQLGGEAAIELAVDKFYDRVLKDERIKHFFDNVDMNQQRKHQNAFLTYDFGAENAVYNGRTMRGLCRKKW